MNLARETWLLLVIGVADLVSTTFLVRYGLVREANPMMAWYLVHFGVWAFCAAKTTLLVCPLVILEWARRIKPHLALWALRITLTGYLLLYLGAVWHVNEAHIERVIAPHWSKLSRFWSYSKKPVAPFGPSPKPMALPIEQEPLTF